MMPEEEGSPWLKVFAMMGIVAVVTMLIALRMRDTEPEWVGEPFAKRSTSAPNSSELVKEEPIQSSPSVAVPEVNPPEAPPAKAPLAPVQSTKTTEPRAPVKASGSGKGQGVFSPKEGAKLDALWDRYVAKSPVMQAYDKELRKDPHLNALMDSDSTDVFGRLKAELSSKHFRQTTLKFVASREMVSFLMDAIKGLSPESLGKVSTELNRDKVAKDFVNDVSESSGIPTGLLLGGGKAPSQQEMVDAALKQFQQNQPPGTPRR